MLNTTAMGAYIIASFLQTAEPLQVDINEYFCAIEAVHFEANGEGYKGKQVVLNVIQNRISRVKKWDGFCDVIHAKSQFSYKKMTKVDLSRKPDLVSFTETVEIAYNAVQGRLPDITGGADHYYNPDKIVKLKKWMNKRYEVGKVGSHKMLKLINDNGSWKL